MYTEQIYKLRPSNVCLKWFLFTLTLCPLASCEPRAEVEPIAADTIMNEAELGITQKLSQRAQLHLDASKWDMALYQQDKDFHAQYPEVFRDYPLNKTPFPVAEYDYAVSSLPFEIETESHVFKGISVGEYENPESDLPVDKMTLLVLTNDSNSKEINLVESRNAPYLSAQGSFETANGPYDWVFCSSPDGFSNLIINMKLFDLRFGETVLIYPQSDQSFLYHQLKDSPNNYDNIDFYKAAILEREEVKKQLNAKGNLVLTSKTE